MILVSMDVTVAASPAKAACVFARSFSSAFWPTTCASAKALVVRTATSLCSALTLAPASFTVTLKDDNPFSTSTKGLAPEIGFVILELLIYNSQGTHVYQLQELSLTSTMVSATIVMNMPVSRLPEGRPDS